MAYVVSGWSPLCSQIEIGYGKTERTVTVVCVFHQEIVGAPEKAVDEFGWANSDHQSVARRVAGGLDIRDIAHGRIRPAQARYRRIEVAAAQQMDATLILVVCREPNQVEWLCLKANRSLNHV